jgi:hypothetical protein
LPHCTMHKTTLKGLSWPFCERAFTRVERDAAAQQRRLA